VRHLLLKPETPGADTNVEFVFDIGSESFYFDSLIFDFSSNAIVDPQKVVVEMWQEPSADDRFHITWESSPDNVGGAQRYAVFRGARHVEGTTEKDEAWTSPAPEQVFTGPLHIKLYNGAGTYQYENVTFRAHVTTDDQVPS